MSDTPVAVLLTELVTVSGRTAALDQPGLRRYGVPGTAVVIVATSVRRYLPVCTDSAKSDTGRICSMPAPTG